MLTLSPFREDRLDDLVAFLTRLNDDPAHHIGFFGYGRAEIEQYLRDFALPLDETFLLAERDGTLAGVFGVEYDLDVGQAWLHGPMVEDVDWDATADALYDGAVTLIPEAVGRRHLFGDVANIRLDAFAARHGFERGDENTIMTLSRGQEPSELRPRAAAFEPRFAAALTRLHDEAFPRTYYTADQLMQWKTEEGRLILRVEGDEVLGYAFFQLQPAAGQAYLDFIATADPARRQGVARGLLAAVVTESFADARISRVNLTVRAANDGAIALYKAFGFETERTLRGYRREGP